MADLWSRVEPLLERVAKPSRYVDREFGAATRRPSQGDIRFCLAYPDTYEVGMSNLGLGILYSLLADMPGVACERVYVPWPDMADELRRAKIPLFSLESVLPVGEVDILGITLQYELTYTNILELLDLADIPVRAADRSEGHPIVLGGGPCAADPEPVAPFFDAILVGEAEEALPEVVRAVAKVRRAEGDRAAQLDAVGTVEGMYLPASYEVEPTGRAVPVGAAPERVRRRLVADLDAIPIPRRVPIPFVDVVHDRLTVEIMRGCTRGCRFCQASMLYRPVRERSRRTVARAARELLGSTGYEELSLASLSTSDHSEVEELLADLKGFTEPRAIATSLPSLRVDAFSIELAELVARVKRTGLTFAPEAGTQRLRDVINKNVTEEQLLDTVRRAVRAGWRRLKLYFMIGLPTETDEDVQAIGELVRSVQAEAHKAADARRGSVRLSVTVSTFVPKALTPFQWEGQLSDDEVGRRQGLLRRAVPRKGVQLSWHDRAASRLEGLLARGDRRTADLIEAAWRAGARFDAWSERFDAQLWWGVADRLGIDVAHEVERRRALEEPLPWDHLDWGIEKRFLLAELDRALDGRTTEDCRWGRCPSCGVCQSFDVENRLAAGPA